MTTFPPNPIDKMIIEVSPNLFFQYEGKQKTWIRLDGFNAFTALATPTENGLMSKDDYNKIYNLLLPPPKTVLKSEYCSFAFEDGIFGFRSSKNDLFIDYNLKLTAKDPAGRIYEEDQLFQIHENTYGLNFTVNLPQLVDKLTVSGQLTYHKEIGPQGKRGETGDLGIDKLETGPQGVRGNRGKNAAFESELVAETVDLSTTTPQKGITDIKINSVSPSENYIIATRANLGNVDYCPEIILPKMSNAKWVVVIDEGDEYTRKYKQMCALEICGNDVCGTSVVLVPFCSTRLFYIDIADIESQVKTRFLDLLAEMKRAKEDLARKWIGTMSGLFSEQKAALCCALDNCNAKAGGAAARERIEGLRVQAAVGGKQLVISSDPADKQFTDDQTGVIQLPNDGKPFSIELDPKVNKDSSHAAEAELPPDKYAATIEDCCLYDPNTKKYSACIVIEYQTAEGTVRLNMPDVGSYASKDEAAKQYIGLTTIFTHTGGPIKMWVCGTDCLSGKLALSFTLAKKAGSNNPGGGEGTAGANSGGGGGSEGYVIGENGELFPIGGGHVEPTEVTMVGATCLTSPAPEAGVFYCDMAPLQVEWYETGWKTRACCGAYVDAGGTKWLVVKKSIGIDMVCGGGESLNTPCIRDAYNFCFHPSIAWPTVNGFDFLGKPTSMQRMFRDINLEAEIINKIRNDQALQLIGNPKDTFEAIIFPYEM